MKEAYHKTKYQNRTNKVNKRNTHGELNAKSKNKKRLKAKDDYFFTLDGFHAKISVFILPYSFSNRIRCCTLHVSFICIVIIIGIVYILYVEKRPMKREDEGSEISKSLINTLQRIHQPLTLCECNNNNTINNKQQKISIA